MTKSDVLDEVMEILIKKAMEDSPFSYVNNIRDNRVSRSEKEDGIFTAAGKGKQTPTIQ